MNKEEYARLLAKRAERAVKFLKIIVAAAAAVVVLSGVYCILALTVFSDKQSAFIAIIVLMACLLALAVAVVTVLIYAYYNLSKLKKIK